MMMSGGHEALLHALVNAQKKNEQLVVAYAREVVEHRSNIALLSDKAPCGRVAGEKWGLRGILRSMNPERAIRRLVRNWLCNRGKGVRSLALNVQAPYSITLEGQTFFFHTGVLADRRGVGRVARALLNEMVKRSVRDSSAQDVKLAAPIHFFPSVHWCPDVLPERSVVLVHDVIPLLFKEIFPQRVVDEWHRKYIPIIRHADMILSISHSSADDIARLAGIKREDIIVIYNGVDVADWGEDASIAQTLPKAPYFVCIGSSDYHKNIDVILKALGEPSAEYLHLVVVGNVPSKALAGLPVSVTNRVHVLTGISDAQLAHVLKSSKGLLFPSLYEGFGLPPIEALMLGVPSICSARPAMTELLDDLVVFCDAVDPAEWANAMNRLATVPFDENRQEQFAELMRLRFNWPRAVDELCVSLREL